MIILPIFYPIFQDLCHFIQLWKISPFFYNNLFGFREGNLPPPGQFYCVYHVYVPFALRKLQSSSPQPDLPLLFLMQFKEKPFINLSYPIPVHHRISLVPYRNKSAFQGNVSFPMRNISKNPSMLILPKNFLNNILKMQAKF